MSLKNVYCRAYQVCFAVGARLLPWRRPECITGLGSFARVPSLLAERGVRKPLIVASRRQSQTPAFQEMLGHLAGWSLYTGVTANPRVETVEAIAAQYHRSGCDGFVAVGDQPGVADVAQCMAQQGADFDARFGGFQVAGLLQALAGAGGQVLQFRHENASGDSARG